MELSVRKQIVDTTYSSTRPRGETAYASGLEPGGAILEGSIPSVGIDKSADDKSPHIMSRGMNLAKSAFRFVE